MYEASHFVYGSCVYGSRVYVSLRVYETHVSDKCRQFCYSILNLLRPCFLKPRVISLKPNGEKEYYPRGLLIDLLTHVDASNA